MPTRRWLLIAAVLLVVIGGWAAWTFWPTGSSDQAATSGARLKAAPAFELPDPAGKLHKLEELRGTVVLVHFWASWCPPCLDEMPQVVALANDLKGKKFKVVAISLDDKWEDALKILPVASTPSDMISLIDLKQKISDAYGSYQYPESYLLNPNLEIVAKLVGGQKWDSPMIRGAIEKLIPKS